VSTAVAVPRPGRTPSAPERIPLPAGLEAEAEFVERLRGGDEAAYTTLVREQSGRLMSVACRFLGREEDCADAVQDTFLLAFRSLESFQATARLSTWLHRILVNVCLTKLRSRSRRPAASLDDLLASFDESGRHSRPVRGWAPDASSGLADAETRAWVRRCVDQLPERYRVVLLLRDIEELNTEETAGLLRISAGAVKTRLHRARQALRSLLEPRFCQIRATPPGGSGVAGEVS
jgi:RNA polymerase sigma-70 factor, ECF subfamily